MYQRQGGAGVMAGQLGILVLHGSAVITIATIPTGVGAPAYRQAAQAVLQRIG